MRHKFYWSCILISLLFFSCKTVKEVNKENLYGKHQWHGVYGVASNITLNSDGTFIYHWQQGLLLGTTKGDWKLNENILILNSERQPSEKKYNIIAAVDQPQNNEFEIKIIDKDTKDPLIFANCSIMKDTFILEGTSSDENGICKLQSHEDATKLVFNYVGIGDVEIPLNTINIKAFILEMKELDYYQYFTNQKWKIKNGKIFNPEIRKDRYVKSKYYEKVTD